MSKSKVSLAKEMALPEKRLLGTWEIMRNRGTNKKLMALPLEEVAIEFDTPKKLEVYNETLDRVEARGLGFSELQSYWALPFPEFSIVGDVCTVKGKKLPLAIFTNNGYTDKIYILFSLDLFIWKTILVKIF